MGDGNGKGRKDALSMLDRCHRQLEKRMRILVEATAALASSSGGPGDCDDIDDVLHFLGRAVARHVADEEESILPRLAALGTLDKLLSELEIEHRHHDEIQRDIHAEVAAWSERPPPPEQATRLAELALQLDQAYKAHIEREDAELLPAIKQHFSPEDLANIFEEMQSRRGRS